MATPALKETPLQEKTPAEEQTLGNFTFLDLNIRLDGLDPVSSKTTAILKALDGFEKSHPELDILTFQIQYGEPTEIPGMVDGVWIYHKPHK